MHEHFQRKPSAYICWHLDRLQIRHDDFCHALNLLFDYGAATSPAETGELLADLLQSYVETHKCPLAKIDLSHLAADYLCAKAQEQILERFGVAVSIDVRGERAFTDLNLNSTTFNELLDIAVSVWPSEDLKKLDFPAPAGKILAKLGFKERLHDLREAYEIIPPSHWPGSEQHMPTYSPANFY